MIVQREVQNTGLAKLLQSIDETELTKILDPYLKKKKEVNLIKTGKHGPFKPFNAIKMKGKGPSASEMVIQDRL
jgi:hypothetical protein